MSREGKKPDMLLRFRFKDFLKWAWVFSLWSLGLLRFAKRAIARRAGVVVLTFHRVLPDAAMSSTSSLPGMVVSQSTFASCLRYLSQHFEVLNLQETNRSSIFCDKRLRIAVTFDDGWKDSYELAHPIAQNNKIPMVIFICSRTMGTKSPFWPERVVRLLRNLNGSGAKVASHSCQSGVPCVELEAALDKREYSSMNPEKVVEDLKSFPTKKRDELIKELESVAKLTERQGDADYPDETMSWSQAARLSDSGVVFGAHTQHHSILTNLALSDARLEISDSKREIEEQLGQACQTFAYPNGNYNREVRDAVEHAGYALAFTTRPGYWSKDADPWLIPRVNIWEGRLVGPTGKFSKVAFQYSVLWKAFRASRKREL